MAAILFKDDEPGYLEWISSYPSGLVINTTKNVSANYLALHRANCRTIKDPKQSAGEHAFTGKGYIKICSQDIQGLLDWMQQKEFVSFTHKCSHCSPDAPDNLFNQSTSSEGLDGKVGNPDWTRDELILALDLYFREPSARGSKTHPAVIELSRILNELPIHIEGIQGSSFRNPSGVGMKLSNFLKYDPSYAGKGLERGAKLEKVVWDEFANDRERLSQIAQSIKDNYQSVVGTAADVDDEDGAVEGKILTKIHLTRERDKGIVKKKKQKVLAEQNALKCEVCSFDFFETYGEIGKEFAECHHDKPVSMMAPGEKTKLSDLRIVCANCHRMLHRSKPWPTVQALKAKFTECK